MRRHRTMCKVRGKRSPSKTRWYRKLKAMASGFAILIFVAAFALPAIAQEAEETEGPGEKLVEGIEETATGWVEVPQEIVETSEESNPIEGVTVGLVKGAGEAVIKTTEGAVKAATFYIPEEEKEAEKEVEEEAEDIDY